MAARRSAVAVLPTAPGPLDADRSQSAQELVEVGIETGVGCIRRPRARRPAPAPCLLYRFTALYLLFHGPLRFDLSIMRPAIYIPTFNGRERLARTLAQPGGAEPTCRRGRGGQRVGRRDGRAAARGVPRGDAAGVRREPRLRAGAEPGGRRAPGGPGDPAQQRRRVPSRASSRRCSTLRPRGPRWSRACSSRKPRRG